MIRRNNFYKWKNDSRAFKKSRNFNVRLNYFKLFFVDKEFTLKYDLVVERSVAASDPSWQRVANNLNDLLLTANDESVKEKLETSWWTNNVGWWPAFSDLITGNLNDDEVTPK